MHDIGETAFPFPHSKPNRILSKYLLSMYRSTRYHAYRQHSLQAPMEHHMDHVSRAALDSCEWPSSERTQHIQDYSLAG